jgi:hypothetical protein
MFDRKVYNNQTYFPSTIKVEEKRAPTDESIRLAEEFRDKALNSILHSAVLEDSGIEIAYVVFECSAVSFGHELRVIYKHKGASHVVKTILDGPDIHKSKYDKAAFMAVVEDLTKRLAREILKGCFPSMVRAVTP